MIFLSKSEYSVRRPLSKAKTHCMVNWLQLLNQLNFVWRYTKVLMQNSSQWCIRNVQLLRTAVNWCWWCFTHTLSAIAAIFSAVRTVFGFSSFALSMRMPVSFTFFTRLLEIRKKKLKTNGQKRLKNKIMVKVDLVNWIALSKIPKHFLLRPGIA